MRRRDLIKGFVGSVAAWPTVTRAQQRDRLRRIGVLMALAADDPTGQARFVAFVQALQELGWYVSFLVYFGYALAIGFGELCTGKP